MQTQIEVPLSKLKPDPVNVRKTDMEPSKGFVASIREQGVLEALTVRKNGEGFLVTNGGKRLKALNLLVHEKAIKPDHPVPCIVREGDDKAARDVSLTVNLMREDMHPVDEFEAFADLLKDGMTPDSIGKKYGMTKREVAQVLALGNLAPAIREAWREEKIEEDAARAFTLEPDAKKQAALYEKLRKNHGLNDWTVRKHICGEDQKKSGMIAFVGVEAYRAAGGATAQDLFAEKQDKEAVVTDLPLLKKLYDKKLADKVAELRAEGWKWVEYQSDLGYNAQWWPAKGKNNVKADDREKYGVMIHIGFHGEVEFKYGVQKPAAQAAAKKSKAKGGASEAAISAALAGRLSNQITRSAAQVLETDPQLALAAIAAALTCFEGPVCITKQTSSATLTDDDDDGFEDGRDFDKQLALFRKKSIPELAKVLAQLAATSLDLGGSTQSNMPLADDRQEDRALLEALDAKKLNAQLRANFDAEDYFKGLTAQVARDAITACDPKYPFTGKEKKSDLAKAAADLVRKSNAGGKAGWLPTEMRTKAYDGPKTKAASAAKPAKKVAKKAKSK
jgi:ParB family chromosome partitioning protein